MARLAELRARVRGIDCGTMWVCQCCALSHANGECCADDDHGGDGIAPWSAVDERYRVTAGLLAEEHDEECDFRADPQCREVDCECERLSFTWSRCEGCGSALAGDRWAHTLWREPRRFFSGIAQAA